MASCKFKLRFVVICLQFLQEVWLMEWYLMTFIIGLIWGSSVAAELSGNAVEPGLYICPTVIRTNYVTLKIAMFEVWLFCMLVQGFQMCYKQNIQFWTEFHQSGNISQQLDLVPMVIWGERYLLRFQILYESKTVHLVS